MTDEILEKAQLLKSKIDFIQHEVKIWEQAYQVESLKLLYRENSRYLNAELSGGIDFRDLQEFMLEKLRTRLEELEKEYEKL